MFDHFPAPVAMVFRGTLGFMGASLYAVVVAQPWWVPILASAVCTIPSLVRILKDSRLSVVERDNRRLIREANRLRERAEKAESELTKWQRI